MSTDGETHPFIFSLYLGLVPLQSSLKQLWADKSGPWVLWPHGAQPLSSWIIPPWNKCTGVTGLTGNRGMMSVQGTPGSFFPALSNSLNFTIVTKLSDMEQMAGIIYAVIV